MFGISLGEFLLILIVAVIVIPARYWPDVFRNAGRLVKTVREFIWKVQDKVDEFQTEISKYDPTDKLSGKTMQDMMATFAEPIISSKTPVKRTKSKEKAAK
jgi:Sec-independent protein translocase protein TatA